MRSATAVMIRASSTLFCLPIRPIRIPAGIEKRANQIKTIMGMVLESVADSPKSLLT